MNKLLLVIVEDKVATLNVEEAKLRCLKLKTEETNPAQPSFVDTQTSNKVVLFSNHFHKFSLLPGQI